MQGKNRRDPFDVGVIVNDDFIKKVTPFPATLLLLLTFVYKTNAYMRLLIVLPFQPYIYPYLLSRTYFFAHFF
jgi:hypothetical protein